MKKEKISCRNCYGMGLIENVSAGSLPCPACKGKGYVELIKKVDHYEKIEINIYKDEARNE